MTRVQERSWAEPQLSARRKNTSGPDLPSAKKPRAMALRPDMVSASELQRSEDTATLRRSTRLLPRMERRTETRQVASGQPLKTMEHQIPTPMEHSEPMAALTRPKAARTGREQTPPKAAPSAPEKLLSVELPEILSVQLSAPMEALTPLAPSAPSAPVLPAPAPRRTRTPAPVSTRPTTATPL
ncbi:predicted protein [Clavispora lusitaniae ATCC 42720]|uniref:Uncharacterized protein n=1 Tax=Clavispora lusitaniae (strain ATCC 42720) TaxID=306902 RepID=C4Y1G3_CLAL4|nr:uncharacterized protein CLUG_02045 [Clavispora lusitaniae ATCC 42720]EEQ37922.1 predicted protein [Clavispora lusitaniae ATCC 42720]